MGVPKFYRWISERYPCLSETVKEYQIPEFDNLYLDMNGIIHNCSHPNDDDVHFRISEEKIFSDIFHYLEVLFRLIKPQKVFFMAIDGVAPRAKMNQQRGRRFRSAKEAEDKEKEALRKGEVLPEEKRFDSNCITPGTEFMVNLQKQLEYFVKMKVSSDPLWQKTQVILSGHQVPGEGEHKIMEFIRNQRSLPDYNAETRHCLYGLDADLMMLGLCSHEPYFSLLREEVKFGGSKKKNEKRITAPEETTFHLLHLSLLREYLELEFTPLKTKLKFPYDLERIIDDWVLMGFLVGNDFIPHLPHFHINKGALPLLYSAYMDVLPNLDGYINENGTLNLARFEKFMERLAQIDYDHFNDIYADVKWLEERTGRKKLIESSEKEKKPVRNSDTETFLLAKAAEIDELLGLDGEDDGKSVDGLAVVPPDELSELEDVDDEEEENGDSVVSEESDYNDRNQGEEEQFQAEFKLHKRHYYMDKLEYDDVDGSVLRDQAEGYVRAIQWILNYYYNGVCSWSWFYPHHYAPYVSDIKNFCNMKLEFDLGKPFLPYEQLLGVLPAASQALLPAAHRSLMSSDESPIIEFYPTKFQTDKNGKQQEWEAVVLIPFIDEKRLVDAMKDCETKLTEEERRRNSHGPMQIYVWTDKDLGPCESPAYFPTIPHNHCQCTELTRDAFIVPDDKLVKGLHPRFNPDRYIPGFPSIRHLPYTGTLKKSQICVFNMNTLHESMILSLTDQNVPDINEIGPSYCGRTIFVGWPHLVEARVVAVASRDTKYSLETDTNGEPVVTDDKPVVHKIEMTSRDANEWRICEKEIKTKYATRWGVEIGQTHVLVYATPVIGRKYIFTQSGRITLDKQWSPVSTPYALQATVKELQVKEIVGHQYATLFDVFPADSVVFMLGQPGYGLQGRVKPPVANKKDKDQKGKIRIEFENVQEAISEELKKRWMSASSRYMPGYIIAQRLGISPHLVSRITGTVYLQASSADQKSSDRGRKAKNFNVGLSLKYNKINQEVPGWSKRSENTWLYSHKTMEVLGQYIEEFPELFDFLSTNIANEDYSAAQIFGPDEKDRLAQLQEFIESLPCAKAERQPCGTASIDLDTLKAIVTCGPPKKAKLKPLIMAVRPHLLYKPDLSMGSAPPDASTTYQLLDRVVNVRQGYSVPLGLRGTVIGIKNAKKSIEVIYEVIFDQEFQGGLPVRGLPETPNRVYHLPSWAMINLTHGRRQTMDRERPTAIVHPSGKAVPKQDSIKSQPKQNHASYKAAAEKQTVAAKVAAQPKILSRTKSSNGTPQVGQAKQQTGRALTKTAPSPSSVPQPTPFMNIWNSLLKQHEQMQQKQAAEAQPTKQQAQPKKHKESTQSPKVPSLQEAAKILPKVPKPVKVSSEQPEALSVAPPTIPAANPQIPPPTIPMAPSLPLIPGLMNPGVPLMAPPPMVQFPSMVPMVPLGAYHPQMRPAAFPVAPPLIPLSNAPLSVQQLFDFARQATPTFQPPATLKLHDIAQCKGLGVPFYNYSTLPDGTLLAEVSLISSGVIGKAEGKTREEASERAASQVLQHEIFAQRMPAPGIPLGQPVMFYPHPPVSTQPRVPTAAHRAPVPNSFVPTQVTRHSIQKQPRQQQAAPSTPSKNSTHETSPAKQKPSTPSKVEAAPSVPASVRTQERPIAAKPPGSRLAIRFNGP